LEAIRQSRNLIQIQSFLDGTPIFGAEHDKVTTFTTMHMKHHVLVDRLVDLIVDVLAKHLGSYYTASHGSTVLQSHFGGNREVLMTASSGHLGVSWWPITRRPRCGGRSDLTRVGGYASTAHGVFTREAVLFADGFESGGLGAWSLVVGP
jgi:hypothetical protein